MDLNLLHLDFIFGPSEVHTLGEIPDHVERDRRVEAVITESRRLAAGQPKESHYLAHYGFEGYTGAGDAPRVVERLVTALQPFPSAEMGSSPLLRVRQGGKLYQVGGPSEDFPAIACFIGPGERRLMTQSAVSSGRRLVDGVADSIVQAAAQPTTPRFVVLFDRLGPRPEERGALLVELEEAAAARGFSPLASPVTHLTPYWGTARRWVELRGFIGTTAACLICLGAIHLFTTISDGST